MGRVHILKNTLKQGVGKKQRGGKASDDSDNSKSHFGPEDRSDECLEIHQLR